MFQVCKITKDYALRIYSVPRTRFKNVLWRTSGTSQLAESQCSRKVPGRVECSLLSRLPFEAPCDYSLVPRGQASAFLHWLRGVCQIGIFLWPPQIARYRHALHQGWRCRLPEAVYKGSIAATKRGHRLVRILLKEQHWNWIWLNVITN